MDCLYAWWMKQKEEEEDLILYSPSPVVAIIRYPSQDGRYIYEGVPDVDILDMFSMENTIFADLILHHPRTEDAVILFELVEDPKTGYWYDFTSDELGVLLKVLPGGGTKAWIGNDY